MRYTEIFEIGSPVICRTYTSGVIIGRLVAGEGGAVALEDWRWIRRWSDVGGEGSVYDLVHSDKVPDRRGPFTAERHIVQQADVMAISEETYERLAKG